MIADEQILGVVQHSQPSKDGPGTEFCRLRPTHIWNGSEWAAVHKPKLTFPDQGLVFWYRPKTSPQKGSVWIFQVSQQPHYSPENRRHDQLQVDAKTPPFQPIELVDLEGFERAADLRRALASGSLQVRCSPVARVMVTASSLRERWLGPLDAQQAVGVSEGLATAAARNGFGQLRVIPDDDKCSVEIDGVDCVLFRHDKELPDPAGLFDAQSDLELFRAILKRARKWNPKAAAGLGATRQVFEEYIRSLSEATLIAEDRLREDARVEAAKEALREFDAIAGADSQFLESVVDELLEHESVRRKIESVHESQLAERKLELEREASDALADARRQVVDAREEVARARKELEQIPSAMHRAVQSALAEGVNKLSQDILIQSLLKWTSTPALDPHRASQADRPGIISERKELLQAIAPAASASGLDAYTLGVGVSLLAGSGLLLLAGPTANSAAQGIASVLSGAAVCRVAVASTMFGQADLLTAACTTIGHSTCLNGYRVGDFLREAMSREHVSTLILQGCNRAPIESVVLDVLEAEQIANGNRSFAWIDANGKPQSITIDRRVVILGTLTPGVSTFQIPIRMQLRLPVLWAGRETKSGVQWQSQDTLPQTAVASELWSSLGSGAGHAAGESLNALHRHFQAASPRRLSQYVARIVDAIGDVDIGVGEALAALASGRISKETRSAIEASMSDRAREVFSRAVANDESEVGSFCERASQV